MNDFSELERELRKLRPAQPSPVLFARVEQVLGTRGVGASSATQPRVRFGLPHNWWPLGFGLAAAAVLVLFVIVGVEHQRPEKIVQSSPASETPSLPLATERSTSPSRFVPAGGTNVVYNARDEGLHFANGSERPVRRVRYQTQQTWRWRNPKTGESLRVSYPSEEIVLIPVSGQ